MASDLFGLAGKVAVVTGAAGASAGPSRPASPKPAPTW